MLYAKIRDLIIKDIEAHAEWREEVSRGKMFGFLIYEDSEGREQYLKAYSGQIGGRSDWDGYVPAIFDYLQPDGYFKTHEAVISNLNQRIKEAEALLQPPPSPLTRRGSTKRSRVIEEMKAERKERSQTLQRWLFTQFRIASPSASPQSSPTVSANHSLPSTGRVRGGAVGASLLSIFQEYAVRNHSKQTIPPSGTGECCAPKLLNYANQHGIKAKAIAEFWYGNSPKGIIRHHGQFYEPCQAKCMPLLWFMMPEGCKVYPFMRQSPPVPKDLEILWQDEWFVAVNKPAGILSVPGKRQLPNVQEMLSLPRPLRREGRNKVAQNSIETPPSSIEERNKLNSSEVETPPPFGGGRGEAFLPVHRLDMDTSGILLFAKSEEALVAMQRLFAEHKDIKKEYVAIVEETKLTKLQNGKFTNCDNETPASEPNLSVNPSTAPTPFVNSSTRKYQLKIEDYNTEESTTQDKIFNSQSSIFNRITLPLSPDFLNRPMQRVDYENGKEAITEYRLASPIPSKGRGEANSPTAGLEHPLLSEGDGGRLLLSPLTGRTHQLRIHCAHPDGLGRPIVGDPLYGTEPAERMMLHATRLTFKHPFTGKQVEIYSPPPF